MKQQLQLIFVSFVLILTGVTAFAQNSDREIQQIIQEKRVYNLNNNEMIGYKIQLFNGISETRARSIYSNFMAMFPDVNAQLFFEQPEWKVQVGNYSTQLEANKALLVIRKEFANAFPLKTKIRVE
jgi:hypothetical protein